MPTSVSDIANDIISIYALIFGPNYEIIFYFTLLIGTGSLLIYRLIRVLPESDQTYLAELYKDTVSTNYFKSTDQILREGHESMMAEERKRRKRYRSRRYR